MPRGVSLTPHARNAQKDDLSQELKLSLFEYPTEVVPLARAFSAASPLGNGVDGGGGSTFALPRGMKRKNPSARPVQVRVFDGDGNLTSKQTGVHVFHLKRETFFFVLRSLSWTNLLSFSMVLYAFILLGISTMYYFWGWACGAHETTTVVSSFYFTIVSLAANGGYMGEDADTMGDPGHTCYRGRTLIVMLCSYVNILFVGLVAALVVGKAEYTGALANRIEFSDFCTLVRLPGRIDAWRLAFRMANLENKKPLAHGQLRLFVVSAEPLKEYRMAKRERLHLRRKLEAMEWETKEYLLERAAAAGGPTAAAPLTAELLENKKSRGGAVSNASFSAAAMTMADDPNIRAIQNYKQRLAREKEQERARRKEEKRRKREQRRRAKHHHHHHRHVAASPPGAAVEEEETAVYVAEEPMKTGGQHAPRQPSALLPQKEREGKRKRRGTRGDDGGSRVLSHNHSHSPIDEEDQEDRTTTGSRSRSGKHREQGAGLRARRGRRGLASRSDSGKQTRSPSSSQSSGSTRTATRSRASSASSTASSSSSSSSKTSTTSSSSSSTNHSAKTNSSVPDSVDDARSPVFRADSTGVSSFADLANLHRAGSSGGLGYGTSYSPTEAAHSSPVRKASGGLGRPTSAKVSAADERTGLLGSGGRKEEKGKRSGKQSGGGARRQHHRQHGDGGGNSDSEDIDAADYLERVHINVSELDWSAPGESYQSKGEGQLSLWYPATITHMIDERSPLYRFMDIPRVGAALGARGSAVQRTTPSSSSGLSSRKFQIVAVFDATEMETGATIMAKHTYVTTDIVTHYKFSSKLIHMNPESGEVLLDYHYFNDILPVTAVESSTADSEG